MSSEQEKTFTVTLTEWEYWRLQKASLGAIRGMLRHPAGSPGAQKHGNRQKDRALLGKIEAAAKEAGIQTYEEV